MAQQERTSRSVTGAIALLCMLALIALIVPVASNFYQIKEYHSYTDRIHAVIEQMSLQRPRDVDAHVWDETCNWLHTATANVCFSPEHVPLADVRRLCIRFESQANDAADLATAEWMWEQFAAASPHGARYAKRHRATYLLYVEEQHPELLTDAMRERLRVARELWASSEEEN